MTKYFGCDAHKRYSIFTSVDDAGSSGPYIRVENERSLFRGYLKKIPPRSKIAVETVGNWYWMVDEMEKAGHIPLLANAGKAKAMMGQINKTDKLDAKGLALLLRCHAKRLEEWGEWMREELLLDVPHRQVVFTIPRMLRIFFKFNRRLLGELCRCALRSLVRYFEVLTGSELMPGAVAAIQTFGARINLHPLCGAPHNGCYVKRLIMWS